MLEFDIFVPLVKPDGRKVSKKKLDALKALLLAQFGGVTYFPQNNEGLWKLGDFTFRDRIVILRIIARRNRTTKRFFTRLKKRMEGDWEQKEVLIVSRAIKLV